MSHLGDLAREIALEFGVPVADLTSRTRTHRACEARQAFCHLAQKRPGVTIKGIANFLARDHTTVLYSVSRSRDLIKTSPEFRESVDRVRIRCQCPAPPLVSAAIRQRLAQAVDSLRDACEALEALAESM